MQVVPVSVVNFPLNLALRRITLNLTRDGEQTASQKIVLLISPSGMAVGAAFVARNGVSDSQLFLASAVDGEWLLLARDDVVPKRAAARYPQISGDVTFTLDLSESGASGGAPATLPARVTVDGALAPREVLAVEQQTDGEWRIAGHGRTDENGETVLDLRVTGVGRIYALGLDDWGTEFQPNLVVAVGDTIRPTLMRGWLYRITEAGTLPGTEPTWWDETLAGPQLLGTARAEVVRYYRPQAHGPIPVEVS